MEGIWENGCWGEFVGGKECDGVECSKWLGV